MDQGENQKRAFDKYEYYQRSVQSPEDDANFMATSFKSLVGREPQVMREDFCGGFALCCEWVRRDPNNTAIGVDLDAEPLAYGKQRYLGQLSAEQQRRVTLLERNVLDPELPQADMICALNFSYMGIKERAVLKDYIANCFRALAHDGMLVFDSFGGGATQEPNVNEIEYDDFSYFWDQDLWNPITHEATFYIHYKRTGEPKRERVFTYDWRLWSLPELRDIMLEVGFRDVRVFWEGTDDDGDGNGEFTETTEGDQCESWVAYIVAMK